MLMPKQVPEEEMDAIASAVAGHADGVGAERIREAIPFSMPPKTLQRRLNKLEEEGRIRSTGRGKGKRYYPEKGASNVEVVTKTGAQRLTTLDADWLGLEAREIQQIVTQPTSKRRPAGYDPEFLKSYEPNKTFYLAAGIRERLAEMGKVGIKDLPAGTYMRQILDRLLIDLAWNSSRLEGNTYSLLETQRLLELGETADGKATEEAQMILNHKAAIELLADPSGEIGFNRYTICNLHALLSDNLLPEPAACGRLRSVAVGIGGSVFHPLEVPQQIEENFQHILSKAETIEDPYEAAFFVMVQLPYLQAFEDVNKRVSRLAANIPLIRHNLCPLSFVDVEAEDYLNGLIGIYELQRIDYLRDVFVWAYTRSAQRYSAVRQSLGEPDAFRLKYRTQIGKLVCDIVQDANVGDKASSRIRGFAEKDIPGEVRTKFMQTVEMELKSLHEGNIARYRLRPAEFAHWRNLQSP